MIALIEQYVRSSQAFGCPDGNTIAYDDTALVIGCPLANSGLRASYFVVFRFFLTLVVRFYVSFLATENQDDHPNSPLAIWSIAFV